jgi:hypothetical protein
VFGGTPIDDEGHGYQATLVGNTVEHSTKWGITLHRTSYTSVRQNVIYDAHGAGLMTEDGSEAYNVIDGNFAAVINGFSIDVGGQGRHNQFGWDFGFDGSAFWFHGINNYIRNNIAVNSRLYGYTFSLRELDWQQVPLPNFQGADQNNTSERHFLAHNMLMPVAEFSNNEVYSSMGGLTAWNLGVICCDELIFQNSPQIVFTNTKLWNISRYGFFNYATHRLLFDGLTAYDDSEMLWPFYHSELHEMFHFRDYEVREFIVRNATVHNFTLGMQIPPKMGSIYDPYGNVPGTVRIESSNFRNRTNFFWETTWAVTPNNAPRDVFLTNVSTGPILQGPGTDLELKYSVDCFDGPSLNPPQPVLREWPSCSPQMVTYEANKNLTTPDRVFVTNWQNTPGDNFRVFYQRQAPNEPMRASDPAINMIGCPVVGLTNAQCLASYGVTLGGELATCTNTRTGITGYVCTTP